MKRNAVIAALLLLVVFAFSACAGAALDGQTADGAPAFLRDIGKTLSDLKSEQPAGKVIVSLGSFPDSAAICFGEDAEYAHFFFGTQSGDAEKAMSECEKALKCAGFVTTAGVLFPDMDEEMSFDAFFSLIGVDEYEYFGEEMVATGWLRFLYDGMEVWANTNEANADGGWNIAGEKIVKRSTPVSIADTALSNANLDLAETVMFDWTGTWERTGLKERFSYMQKAPDFFQNQVLFSYSASFESASGAYLSDVQIM